MITRDDAPNCKLSSLAQLFNATTTPNHRALSDARATVDVLHGLMERLGGQGVHTLEELATFTSRVSQAQRRKRHLAEGLPHLPGVYLFRDDRHRVLYVGTSKDLRSRVRSYFTASETRTRMGEMVGLAESVTGIPCATPLEAEVRELRLIAEHKPKYNRRSRFPEKVHFVKLTREAWPRLSLVRRVLDDDADYLGPFSSKKTAEKCLAALHDTFPVRQCSDKLAREPSRSACVLAEMGRCLSPCDGSVDTATYAAVVRQLRDTLLHRPDEVVDAINRRMTSLAELERFEEAGVHRDRLATFVRAAARTQRLSALTRCPEVVAARREDDGRWSVHVVRHGRLAAAGVIPPGCRRPPATSTSSGPAPRPCARRPGPVPAATAEETEKVLRWLESPGIRLVDVDGEWVCPVARRHPAPAALRRGQPVTALARALRRAAAAGHGAPPGALNPHVTIFGKPRGPESGILAPRGTDRADAETWPSRALHASRPSSSRPSRPSSCCSPLGSWPCRCSGGPDEIEHLLRPRTSRWGTGTAPAPGGPPPRAGRDAGGRRRAPPA